MPSATLTGLVACACSREIFIYDAQTQELVGRLRGHRQDNPKCICTHRGQTFFNPKCSVLGHTGLVQTLAFSPDGSSIASAGMDSNVKIWALETGEVTACLKSMRSSENRQNEVHGYVKSVQFSPDGKWLASGGDDWSVRLWNTVTHEEREMQSTGAPQKIVSCVAFSLDGNWLASGCWQKTIKIWEVASFGEVRTMMGHSRHNPECMCQHSEEDDFRGFNTTCPVVGPTRRILSLAFNTEGTRLVSGSGCNTVTVWDVETGKAVRVMRGHYKFNPECKCEFGQWNVHKTFAKDCPVRGHSRDVHAVAINREGTMIVSGSHDKTVKLWDSQSGKELSTMRHSVSVHTVDFHNNGVHVVSGSNDKTIKIWDVSTPEPYCVATVEQISEVASVAFSPDESCSRNCRWGREWVLSMVLAQEKGLHRQALQWQHEVSSKSDLLLQILGHVSPFWKALALWD